MPKSLFRPEVCAAQTAQWIDSARLRSVLSFDLVTGSAPAIAFAITAFAVGGEVNRKADRSGPLMSILGTLKITNLQPSTDMRLL